MLWQRATSRWSLTSKSCAIELMGKIERESDILWRRIVRSRSEDTIIFFQLCEPVMWYHKMTWVNSSAISVGDSRESWKTTNSHLFSSLVKQFTDQWPSAIIPFFFSQNTITQHTPNSPIPPFDALHNPTNSPNDTTQFSVITDEGTWYCTREHWIVYILRVKQWVDRNHSVPRAAKTFVLVITWFRVQFGIN